MESRWFPHKAMVGPIKISLSKTKIGFDFGSSDLGTSIFPYIPKNPKVLKIGVFSFKMVLTYFLWKGVFRQKIDQGKSQLFS